ncbi:MAG: dihydrolipoyl dehydrogenase [Methylococcales bacterium]|nr:dihydrolipoyl dehydrogenase [Methylococcales bacterium]
MAKLANQYDVIVIGAGPAGYVAAIRSAQLGLKTCCIDQWQGAEGQACLGGAYVNAGCISALALQESARVYQLVQHGLAQHGLSATGIKLDLKQTIARKNAKIHHLSDTIASAFARHDIQLLHGAGQLQTAGEVLFTPIARGKAQVLHAPHIILATGSKPVDLPCASIDHEAILDTTDALNLTELPKRLGIIGAGIIGLGLAGIWQQLGSDVVLLDAQQTFLPIVDRQIADYAYRLCQQRGLDLKLGARVISSKVSRNKVVIEYQDDNKQHSMTLDKLLVASGRKPNSENVAAPEAELLLDEQGYVHVDDQCCTTVPGVYAIGDLTLLGPMLAHKGLEEGIFVAEKIAGIETPINYQIMPSVIYTEPEIAWVGHTEQSLIATGQPYKKGVFELANNGRAVAIDRTDGMVKILTHAETDSILGVHIIGVSASELIAEAVLAMEFSASAEDLARTIHAHPTISEALHEAALALDGRALHLP